MLLVDRDERAAQAGLSRIADSLDEAVRRKIFPAQKAGASIARISAITDWARLKDADLAIEAVFEDLDLKRAVFRELELACSPETLIATNTSSFRISDVAAGMQYPQRAIGLHYFFHAAKNRLVEVIPGEHSDPALHPFIWSFQERIGKVPIASADAFGFIVNRFFVPWLNESVRILEEGAANIATIDAAAKQAFGIGMGPFELMNVTGVPIAYHAQTTLHAAFGEFYCPANALKQQVAKNATWDLSGDVDSRTLETIGDRLFGTVFYIAAQLVDEHVGRPEDVDIGARVGLSWPVGPFEMANRMGIRLANELAMSVIDSWALDTPDTLRSSIKRNKPFHLSLVRTEIVDGIAKLTLDRPDALNALNEDLVQQLHEAFRAVANDINIRAIVIAGSGKAFIAGADIRYFVNNILNHELDRTVEFARRCQTLLEDVSTCSKPVVARVHGLALGGGLELALACDYIVATDKASVAFPETGIGIYPAMGGTQRTTRRIGVGLAKFLVLSGQMLQAKQAAAIGLIDEVVSADQIDETIRQLIDEGPRALTNQRIIPPEFADVEKYFSSVSIDDLLSGQSPAQTNSVLEKALVRISKNAPLALRLANRLIDEGARIPLSEALSMELQHLKDIFRTQDAYLGLQNAGKAQPAFAGS